MEAVGINTGSNGGYVAARIGVATLARQGSPPTGGRMTSCGKSERSLFPRKDGGKSLESIAFNDQTSHPTKKTISIVRDDLKRIFGTPPPPPIDIVH
mmetsp:Transcript_26509/g.40241  ORF Transcript_26509/g.40241 Transcript_26509/m.40241 type:complete len:97 (-) Transcript_26509:14-304(-)